MTTAFAPMSTAETAFWRAISAHNMGQIAEAKSLAIAECTDAGTPLPCPTRWADSYYHRVGWASGLDIAGGIVADRIAEERGIEPGMGYYQATGYED